MLDECSLRWLLDKKGDPPPEARGDGCPPQALESQTRRSANREQGVSGHCALPRVSAIATEPVAADLSHVRRSSHGRGLLASSGSCRYLRAIKVPSSTALLRVHAHLQAFLNNDIARYLEIRLGSIQSGRGDRLDQTMKDKCACLASSHRLSAVNRSHIVDGRYGGCSSSIIIAHSP